MDMQQDMAVEYTMDYHPAIPPFICEMMKHWISGHPNSTETNVYYVVCCTESDYTYGTEFHRIP